MTKRVISLNRKKGGKGQPKVEAGSRCEAAFRRLCLCPTRSRAPRAKLCEDGPALRPPLAATGAPAPKPQYLKFVKRRKSCGDIKIYNGGTGTLGTHESNTAKAGAGEAAPPPNVDFDSCINKLIEFLAGNVLPLSLASADQFDALIQEALRIGLGMTMGSARPLTSSPTPPRRSEK